MRALYLKEIRGFLSSIVGYVFIFIFLLSSGLFHWILSYPTNLLDGSQADMIPFFNMSPNIFLILIPAITMRSFSDERRTGTIELLFTKPISDLDIVLAKYFAGISLLVISIAPTLVYYFTMNYLGKPVGVIDNGATFTSYLGLILLGSALIAVGIFTSSLTSSQIISFLLSMFLCWFMYDGLALAGSFAQFGNLDFIIKYFSMSWHYDALKKGVVSVSDVVYFLSVIVVFISLALTVVKTLKKG